MFRPTMCKVSACASQRNVVRNDSSRVNTDFFHVARAGRGACLDVERRQQGVHVAFRKAKQMLKLRVTPTFSARLP
jgi:hypothetical protein